MSKTIVRVTSRPGKTQFNCPVNTIDWVDGCGTFRTTVGTGLNPEVHSLLRYAEWQGVKTVRVP